MAHVAFLLANGLVNVQVYFLPQISRAVIDVAVPQLVILLALIFQVANEIEKFLVDELRVKVVAQVAPPKHVSIPANPAESILLNKTSIELIY